MPKPFEKKETKLSKYKEIYTNICRHTKWKMKQWGYKHTLQHIRVSKEI